MVIILQMKNRIRWAAHADLFRQGVESAMNITSIETVAPSWRRKGRRKLLFLFSGRRRLTMQL